VKRNCDQCGAEFEAIGKGSTRKRFCCAKCKSTWTNRNRTLKPNITKDCLICGKTFSRYVEPSKLASGKAKALYCSRSCKGIALSGGHHPNWKGGRIVEADGYVMLFRPDHPHANNKGYVFEHRLMMETKIGRLLEPEEVVHHKNDDPSDNRIDNFHLYPSNADHKRNDVAFRRRDEKGRLMPIEAKPDAAVALEPKVDLHLEDCITGMERRLADGSVHLTVTSIPFE
jgi:hypothetical protein